MRFGAILLWEPGCLESFRDRLESVERLGYDLVGLGDSPNSYRDLVAACAVAASSTTRCELATTVTTPVARHPVAVTSAVGAAVELAAGRRIVLGVGTGGSVTAALGRPATTRAEMREFITALKALSAGRPATWQGAELPPMSGVSEFPVFVSAYGPAMMRLAGELADGVILAIGASPSLIAAARERIAAGAEGAGRSVDDVEIWVMSRVAVRESREDALTDIAANLASAASFGLRSPAQLASVPDDYRERVVELQRRYDPTSHVRWDGPNAALVSELGLSDYLAGRFAVVGTPAECRSQVAELEQSGVSCIVAPAVDRDPDGLLQRFSDAVIAPAAASTAPGGQA